MKNKKKRLIFIGFFILFLLFLSFKFRTQEESLKPNNIKIGDSLGVSIHRDVTENDMKNIANAGFKWVRIDIFWERVETKKGKYDFEKTGYDQINNWIKKYDLKPYYILTYSNPLYEKQRSITTPEGRAAFAKFADATVKHYKNQEGIWEIWNEPNTETFWNPQPSYENYVKLVKKTAPVIRKEDPHSLIVGPALSGTHRTSLRWLDKTFSYHLLDYIDAVSVHPYRDDDPETVAGDYQKIKAMIQDYTYKRIQLFAGEWGYSMAPKPNRKISEMKQAEYYTRMMLINRWENIGLSVWYDWKNDGYDENEKEHNFGVMWYSGNPKLTYLAAQTLSANLKDYHFVKKYSLKNSDDYLLEFRNSTEKKALVYWTRDSNHNSKITLKSGKGKVISMLGAQREVEWTDGIDLNFSTSPNYLFID
ncbi:cellulase family glycosylhydrolase [Priestia sp. FSL R5-0597]|uniref:cellulase family glycosylhydrolase n=1 Tax=Priestia TaxID=2800373 RepID=UPI0012B9C25C|nr:cellulase family glycosylhydrolase [Priestia megaterium]